jgi:hypothetical protein
MSVLKYNEFLTEKVVYDMILQSKIIYSLDLINMLNKMKSNKVAKDLLSLYTKEIDPLNYNYINVTDEKDVVSFTPDAKAKEVSKDLDDTWRISDSQRYLTHSTRNNRIFQRLGYNPEDRDCWEPSVGTIGRILKETISPSSGNVYVLFEELVTDPRTSVINKVALRPSSQDEDNRIWKISRNNIKVGRLARAILTASKIKFVDKDIEDFTNQYKATFDAMKDGLIKFDIVSGGDISYWYSHEHYASEDNGTLGSSCMKSVNPDYFDIYTQNKQVRLVILYDESGDIDDKGKYTSKHIKGRALLWNAQCDGSTQIEFMDRIYSEDDSDVDLFKQFAKTKGFWFKRNQNTETRFEMTNGEETKRPTLIVKLDNGDFEMYPYCDTFVYLNSNSDQISNSQSAINADRELWSTEGEFYTVGEDDDD